MSKQCQVSKKSYNKANKICFSNKKHPHRQMVNLQTKRFWLPEEKRFVRLKVSARVLKTITSKGLKAAVAAYGQSQEMLNA